MQGALLLDAYGRSRLTSVGFRRVEPKASVHRRSISRETVRHKLRRSPSIVVVGLARVKLKRFGS